MPLGVFFSIVYRMEKQRPVINPLPTPEQIRNHHGWPSFEAEQNLRLAFFKHFKPQVEECIFPTLELNDNQIDFFLSFFYGIYFINYVTGGQVLPDIDDRELCQWPYIFTNSVKRFAVGTQTEQFKINVNTVEAFSRDSAPDDLNEIAAGAHITDESQRAAAETILYRNTTREQGILTGIEEGHHMLIAKLRHHPSTRVATHLSRLVENDTYSRIIFSQNLETKPDEYLPNRSIRYRSEVELEFLCVTPQAIYTRRYLPDLWENRGFKDYVDLVNQDRCRFLSSRQLLEDDSSQARV